MSRQQTIIAQKVKNLNNKLTKYIYLYFSCSICLKNKKNLFSSSKLFNQFHEREGRWEEGGEGRKAFKCLVNFNNWNNDDDDDDDIDLNSNEKSEKKSINRRYEKNK